MIKKTEKAILSQRLRILLIPSILVTWSVLIWLAAHISSIPYVYTAIIQKTLCCGHFHEFPPENISYIVWPSSSQLIHHLLDFPPPLLLVFVFQPILIVHFLGIFIFCIKLFGPSKSLNESYGSVRTATVNTEERESINWTINHENGTIRIPTINLGSCFLSS